ncbi:MAG: sigma-54-dependent Fis family transcriptional regulator [Candidatus Latescibacteria bacterium]|nr:sigma-54-dependent Fis family transcriptional regulator [Candidatus Latescibacterota bacterium]
MSRILIAEDDRHTAEGLAEILKEEGYDVTAVRDGQQAFDLAQKKRFDILLTDMKMPRLDGLELVGKIKTACPETKIIMMTAFGTVETAVQAMRDGAFHYLTKPVDFDQLLDVLQRAIEESRLKEGLPAVPSSGLSAPEPVIIGTSSKMRDIFEKISKVAKSNATILLRGESGTGKELIARAIHAKSYRNEKQFMEVSCAAIPDNLMESELFGTEKGAYTGALSTTRKGRFELADGGTIFLDEIGDISSTVQVKLLRVLQERRFERLGGTTLIKVDVRVIAATNLDLEKAVREGRYREDLYYRLNVIPIFMPPLREHKEDIPLLIQHFVAKYSRENGMPVKRFSPDALTLCQQYDWPGNVRELEHAVESAVVLSDDETIKPEHLPFSLAVGSYIERGRTLADKMDYAEMLVLKKVLEESGGNRTKAAKVLGVTVRTMQNKVKKYRL